MVTVDVIMSTEKVVFERVEAVHFTEFWKDDPQGWFLQIEAIFEDKKITQPKTKFIKVLAKLDSETSLKIRDIAKEGVTATSYEHVKARLCKNFGLSESERAAKILEPRGLGDQLPSELMTNLLVWLDDKPTSFLLKHIFLRNLPKVLRRQAATVKECTLNELAARVDDMWAAEKANGSLQVAAIGKAKHNKVRDGAVNDGLCFYHATFKKKAHRC